MLLSINELSALVLTHKNPNTVNKYLHHSTEMKTRLYGYKLLLLTFLSEVRRRAASHEEESILLTHETLLHNILTLPAIIPLLIEATNVRSLVGELKRQSEWYNDGELLTVDEDTYLRTVESTLLHFHQELLTERRTNFKIFHEELIMKAMEPERLQRFASAAGLDFMDYMILME
jgi:hypothetical protein